MTPLHHLSPALAPTNGRNGALKHCEFVVCNTPDQFGQPIAKATFEMTRKAQEAACNPVTGRYVLLRVLSEVNGGPWASVAEIGVIGK